MKQHKPLLILGAALAAVALLLLLILASRPALPPAAGGTPAAGSGAEAIISQRFGPPDEWFVAGALGATYTETLAGEGLRVGEGDVYLGQSPPDGPYLPWYAIGRAYPAWDTSALPDGAEVLSASLVLSLPVQGGRAEAMEIGIYRGDWTPPPNLDNWLSPAAEQVGRWTLPAVHLEKQVDNGQGQPLYALEPARTVRLALDRSGPTPTPAPAG